MVGFIIMCLILFHLIRKVFLGHKKNQENKKYAIKVMKKSDMVNKNMVNQGKETLNNIIYTEFS